MPQTEQSDERKLYKPVIHLFCGMELAVKSKKDSFAQENVAWKKVCLV